MKSVGGSFKIHMDKQEQRGSTDLCPVVSFRDGDNIADPDFANVGSIFGDCGDSETRDEFDLKRVNDSSVTGGILDFHTSMRRLTTGSTLLILSMTL